MISERLQGDYVLLRADSLRLLVPQSNLTNIIHLQDRLTVAEQCIKDPKQLLIQQSDQEQQLLALSEDLTLLSAVPKNRFVMTQHTQTATIHWCWTEVQLFNHLDMKCEQLPPIVRTDITPIDAIVTLADGKQAFVCQFDNLLNYLAH